MMRANIDYGVKVIKPFSQFSPGFVMYPTAMYREKLIKCGFVQPLTEADVKPSTEATNSPAQNVPQRRRANRAL